MFGLGMGGGTEVVVGDKLYVDSERHSHSCLLSFFIEGAAVPWFLLHCLRAKLSSPDPSKHT